MSVDKICMTAPRRILPHKTWFITRTCSRRSFFVRPDPTVNQVVKYCAAVAARRTGARLIALCSMSGHFHLTVEDTPARLPDFMAYMDRLVALCLKEHFDIDENVWSPSSYDPVELVTEDALVEKAAYCISNPVAAGLVDRWKKWPGVVSRPDACRRAPEVVERPKVYFVPIPTPLGRGDGPFRRLSAGNFSISPGRSARAQAEGRCPCPKSRRNRARARARARARFFVSPGLIEKAGWSVGSSTPYILWRHPSRRYDYLRFGGHRRRQPPTPPSQ